MFRSAFSRGELNLTTLVNFDADIEFYKRDEAVALKRDYRPQGAGGTWEAMLWHPVPSSTGLQHAYQAFTDWCAPSAKPRESEIMLQTDEGENWLMPEQAFEQFCRMQQQNRQLCLYGEHTLVLPYGDPHTEIR